MCSQLLQSSRLDKADPSAGSPHRSQSSPLILCHGAAVLLALLMIGPAASFAQVVCPELPPTPEDCGGFCDEGEGWGECVLLAPNVCDCVEAPPGDNPPGDDGCNAFTDGTAVPFNTSGTIAPGATLQLTAQLPAGMTVGNLSNTTHVNLTSATVNIVIGANVNGRSSVTVQGGSAAFGSFVCGGIPVGPSTASIQSGSGYIEWATNFIRVDLFAQVSAAGFPTMNGHALGGGSINVATNRITLQSGGAFERSTTIQLPMVSTWATGSLIALMLSAGTLVIQKRRASMA